MSDERNSKLFEEVFSNIRKAAEANLHMQNEMFRQWMTMWPGLPTPQSMWMDKMRDFQKQWSNTVSDLVRKHRETVDRQFQAAIESLDEALRLTEAKTPDEFRKRTEQVCRKTVDCMKEISEVQLREFQEAITRWTDLLTKAGG